MIYKKNSLQYCTLSSTTLSNQTLPLRFVVLGMGFTYQMLQFQEERLACAALALAPLDKVQTDFYLNLDFNTI